MKCKLSIDVSAMTARIYWNISDAHLKGRAVFNEILGDPFANRFFLWGHFAVRVDGQRNVNVDSVVEMALVNDGIAEGPWHLLVDLCDDLLGVLASGANLKSLGMKFAV